MNRLEKYDLKLVYRPSRNQHIEIADELSRMSTRLTFVIRTRNSERIAMTATISTIQKSEQRYRSHISLIDILSVEDFRIDKYRSSSMYEKIVEYLQEEVFALKELNRNRRRQIIRKSKRYVLIKISKISALKYRENNEFMSLCLIEFEVSRFLRAAHENHDHYAVALTLDFLIERVY